MRQWGGMCRCVFYFVASTLCEVGCDSAQAREPAAFRVVWDVAAEDAWLGGAGQNSIWDCGSGCGRLADAFNRRARLCPIPKIDVAPPGLSAACQIGRRSGNRRNARRHPLVVHLRFLVRLEMLWHCLTDAALDFALEDVSAGIGQAVLRGGGCGRFGTA
jgi:hypothetical protein